MQVFLLLISVENVELRTDKIPTIRNIKAFVKKRHPYKRFIITAL